MQHLAALTLQIPVGFWPSTLGGWLAAALALLAIAATIWRFLKVIHDLNGFGTRLNDYEKKVTGIEARMGSAEQDAKFAALDRTNMREAIGRLSTEVQTLAQLMRETHNERQEAQGEIRERLVRIETLLDDARTQRREP